MLKVYATTYFPWLPSYALKTSASSSKQSYSHPAPKWLHLHVATPQQKSHQPHQAFSTISNHLPTLAQTLTQMNKTLMTLLHLWILTKTAPSLLYFWNLFPVDLFTAASIILWLDHFTKHGMIMSFPQQLIPTLGSFEFPSAKNLPAAKNLNVKPPSPSIASTLTLCKILSAMA